MPSIDRGGARVVMLGELVMILDLHRQGLTISAIARRTGLDRKTVHRYIERGLEPPVYTPRPPRPAPPPPPPPPTRPHQVVRVEWGVGGPGPPPPGPDGSLALSGNPRPR